MTGPDSDPLLERALEVSQEVLAAADQANLHSVAVLDAERLRLLQSLRLRRETLSSNDRAVLGQIAELNDRAIGLMEHHRRSKARELDMAAVGRRAVVAYSNTRQHR
ncbi:MAG TPA: hypothetical protein VKG63_00215 [Steroidobacteraceae bacterium]|nr:hypothetical protein [Steroidobacteraceae bacterium]